MPNAKLTGAIGLFCAACFTACAGSSSLLPTAPTSVLSPDSSVQTSVVASTGFGNGHGNGGGNGQGTTPPSAQAPVPPTSKKVELEGLVSAMAGNVLTVDGQAVVVPPTVLVHHGSHQFALSDLKVGDRVHVRAEWVGTVLTASDVKLQNPGVADDEDDEGGDPTDGTPLSVDGLVSLLSAGACPAKTFSIGAQAVQTDATTSFSGGTCNVITDGGHVQVVGVLKSGVLMATQVQIF